MRHYDLYGNSYGTAQEALNAEMAQCAEIDARIADEKIQRLEDEQMRQYEADQQREYERDQKIDYLMSRIEELEKRIEKLESPEKIL